MKGKDNIETKTSEYSVLLFIEKQQQYIARVHGEFVEEESLTSLTQKLDFRRH
jgi:hypothetical protein